MTTPKELIINALWDERRRCNLETPKGRERNEQLEAAIAWLVAQQSEIDRLKASERSAWNAAVQRDEEIDRLKAAQQKAEPVARNDIEELRLSELTKAEKIIAGIRWMAANEGYGIKDAAKKLEAEFRSYAALLSSRRSSR